MESKGFDTPEKQKSVKGDNLKQVKTKAQSIKGAYLGCLCLMMADKRYELVNKVFHKGFLVENNNTPRTCWP